MATAEARNLQLIKGERHLLSSSDDHAVVKQVLATHSTNVREIDATMLLHIVEDALQHAKPAVTAIPQNQLDLDDMMHYRPAAVQMLEALTFTIHKLSWEINFKCCGGSDAHGTTMDVFKALSIYTWDAKLVLTLAAFAVSYGGLFLPAHFHTTSPLAKSLAFLKQLPDILEHTDALKPLFDTLDSLIGAMLDIAKCIIEFRDLPAEYISSDSPGMSTAMAHIPTAAYWTVRSAVACSSQIVGLIGLGHEYVISTTEEWELSSLAHKLTEIHAHLRKQLTLCHQHIDEKRYTEAYDTLVRLFETSHVDNMKVLTTLVHSKDDIPLVDGLTKRRVSLDVLRRKVVMFFICDLDVALEELFVLMQVVDDTHQRRAETERHYEILWLPMIDRHTPWTPEREERFRSLASNMPWYYLQHPSLLAPAAVKYVRDVWRFNKKPLLVVLDPRGSVVCPNALNMMWIWGSVAFPFTTSREEALWKEETWRLDLLADGIDPLIIQWLREDRHICLYGGEDVDWIRRFTALLRGVCMEAMVPLEMIYVGKSNPKDRHRRTVAAIAAEKLSSYWQDPMSVWFFWVRLESMWYSKMQHGRSIEDDNIMREVTTMLSFDASNEGWAVIGRGSEIVKANGKTLLDCLLQFELWKEDAEEVGFVPALARMLEHLHTVEHCTRLVLPGDAGKIKERVACVECGRAMEKFVLYRCCND